MDSEALWPCICIVAGSLLLVLGMVLRAKLKASESCPKTTGIITESSIQSEWVSVGSERMYIVSPKVIYEYQVGGKKYHSSRLALEECNTANENLARQKIEKYPVGLDVEIFYDPDKPEFATLQAGDPSGGMLPFGIATVGAILAAAGIIWLVKLPR